MSIKLAGLFRRAYSYGDVFECLYSAAKHFKVYWRSCDYLAGVRGACVCVSVYLHSDLFGQRRFLSASRKVLRQDSHQAPLPHASSQRRPSKYAFAWAHTACRPIAVGRARAQARPRTKTRLGSRDAQAQAKPGLCPNSEPIF